jgi:hypothetical protein
MGQPSGAPDERFTAIVEALRGNPDVTYGADEPQGKNRFGSSGLKIGGKLFAMLAGGRLVVKLPRQRVDALVASGDGERFDPRRDGRLMKEWLTVDPASRAEWLSLAREALEFVASQG